MKIAVFQQRLHHTVTEETLVAGEILSAVFVPRANGCPRTQYDNRLSRLLKKFPKAVARR